MKIAIFALAAFAATPLYAQAVALPETAPLMTVGQVATGTLRAGTSVPLRTLVELTTKGKKLKVGHRFELEVAEPVAVDGQTVIPAGSPAMGEVTSVRNKGMWGKSGHIEARLLYVRANGRQIRLSGSIDDKGTTGTAGVVGAVAVLPIAGFFITGTSATIAAGSAVRGFVEEDVAVAFAPGTGPAPMMVAPTVPVATPAPAEPAVPALVPVSTTPTS